MKDEITSALPADLDTLPRLRGFRLRGLAMTRLEGFVDATFAFAVTMLIIAGQQVPDDVSALLAAFKHVPSFAASIVVLAIFWRGHWTWSRRFGLEDNVSICISWALIFTMLIYVYPLKVIFGGMFAVLSDAAIGQSIIVRSIGEARAIFALYAAGFTALSVQIVLLNLRAWSLRDPLRLNEREKLLTRGAIEGWSIPVFVGLVSLGLALVVPRPQIGWSGWVY
ncbi:MAG TPA: TMEM175 family protein, partial [Chthoniobacterales bacterium]|nr:TMEM175 family protein [Chthoniobacterales bacterium]